MSCTFTFFLQCAVHAEDHSNKLNETHKKKIDIHRKKRKARPAAVKAAKAAKASFEEEMAEIARVQEQQRQMSDTKVSNVVTRDATSHNAQCPICPV